MSLSKYYKNSPAFRAEELVKKADRPSGGWIPSPTPQSTPFTSQRLSRELTPNLESVKKPAPSVPSEPVPRPPQPSPSSPEPDLPPDSPVIDLQNYVEKSAVEQLNEAAYRQGYSDGLAQAEAEFGSAIKSFQLSCQQLDGLRHTLIANSSQEMLDFALAVAEKILRLSIREQDHTLIATIEEALQKAVRSDEYTIHINPDDYEILNSRAVEIVASISGLNNIVIKKDNTIEKGGVFIESVNCTIDATIASQLELIREEIKKRQ